MRKFMKVNKFENQTKSNDIPSQSNRFLQFSSSCECAFLNVHTAIRNFASCWEVVHFASCWEVVVLCS